MSTQRKEDEENSKRTNRYKKNEKRLGGRGLSLQAFANAKSRVDGYNPALMKRRREFYKNAKHVSKFKKLVKQQQHQQNASSSTLKALQPSQDENEARDGNEIIKENQKRKRTSSFGLEDVYKKKCEEEEKARMEREAIVQAKKEEREKAEVRRKVMKEKMFKKTRHGQPVMKYRIENLLQTIQSSTRSSIG
ncbi:stress response protein nst1-like [Tripterygium wilfordii]|uniref:Stress response protein nst1-like n=1 Tax=Tripterygium wilfordii TaxID=458696 RepID=A0A7J7CZT3_TRIWF|nr:rRNA-processing protein FYV7 [Tripterygium wilfordii]KAF5739570.1 stress response protein nst1-like [Tripterygium wilfordii]